MPPDSLPASHWKRCLSLKKLLVGILLAELLATWSLRGELWTTTGLGLLFWTLNLLAALSLVTLWTFGVIVVHRRFQFGMKTLLLLMLTVGAGFGWLGITFQRTRDQRAVAAVLASRGASTRWLGEGEPGLQSLIGVEYFQDVVEVHFQDPSLTTDADLAQLNVFKIKLERLSIYGPRVTDAGLEHIGELSGLKDLRLAHTQVGDPGLARLRGLTNLERLELLAPGPGRGPPANVTDRGLAHLARLDNLQDLKVISCKMTDGGLSHIARLPNVKTLWLVRTQITDAGLVHLAGLRDLERLNVAFTGVSDAGLAHLKGLSKLEWLCLDGTAVTDMGVEELQKALPNLAIIR